MLGRDASTGSKLRAALMMLAGIGAAALVMGVAFATIRLRETYAVEAKLAALESAHYDLALTCGTMRGEINHRIDVTERVLFGDVVPRVDKAIPTGVPITRIEKIFLDNQKEFRKRLESLERWRLRSGQ